jgi:RND family efflux transporter MFP subunit
MHPAYRSNKPGIAPDCGMKLEPVYADHDSAGVASVLQISAEKQQLIGVRTTEARRTPATHIFRLTGRVVPDETRVYRVTGKVEGWVREIYPPTTGSLVKKGEPLVGVFGRDYRMMQQSYVFALNAAERAQQGAGTFDAVEQNRLPVTETLAALHSAGVDEAQIEEIAKNRQPQLDTRLISPVAGFVQARNVFPNQKFEPGTELYRIVDISRVWILADLYSSEGQYVRPGAAVRISLPAYPRQTFAARVSNVPPEFDSTSRTLKLRLEADNPDFALRPNMLADIEVSATLPAAVILPTDSVIDAGLTHTVYVDRGEGRFEPRAVETGWRYDNLVEIVKGVEAGERVVSAATFLVDSESRLRSAARAGETPQP